MKAAVQKVMRVLLPSRVENVMEVGEGSKRTNTVVQFNLQSNAVDGQRRIDAFVDAAYAYFQARNVLLKPADPIRQSPSVSSSTLTSPYIEQDTYHTLCALACCSILCLSMLGGQLADLTYSGHTHEALGGSPPHADGNPHLSVQPSCHPRPSPQAARNRMAQQR